MHVIEIIPARRWRNTVTGATASIFGAAPYVSAADKPNWITENTGWTWRTDSGTVGLCRPPASTRAQAAEVANQINARRVMELEAHAARYPEQHARCAAKAEAIPYFGAVA